MFARHAAYSLVLLTAAAPALMAQQGKLVSETEPNDDIAHAQVIQLGDTINGTKTYQNIDFFAYDLPAGVIVVLSVPYSSFCAGIGLYDPDGTAFASTDCFGGLHDSLTARTTRAGRYYVSIVHPSDVETPGDEGRISPYKLQFALYTAPPPGPGNPLSRFSAGDEEVTAMVAAPNGDLIVASYELESGSGRARLQRITPDGHATTFATDVNPTGQIAIDAFGDLLVPSGDQGGVVWRYNLTTGARTIFTGPSSGPFPYTGVTIGADGDVWLSMPGGSDGATFSRFDALGTYKGQVAAGAGLRTFELKTAQNGELLFVTQNSGDVYRLVNNTTPVRVITAPSGQAPYGHYGLGGLAVDQDGWIYLYQAPRGKLLLFNAQYQLARDPLAQVLDSVGWKKERIPTSAPAWMRDGNGKMTSRLLVVRATGDENTSPGQREILEVNHSGMAAPGADPMLHFKKKSLRNAAVNVAYADTLGVEEAGSSTWSLLSGQFPDGLSLSSSGVLSGTPSRSGTFDFAVRAADGARAGFGRFSITVGNAPPVQASLTDIANALMGGAGLDAATVQYLDDFGNKNGRLDVGDFRAYLRSQGLLSGAPKP